MLERLSFISGRRLVVVSAAVAAGVTLAGCGGSSSGAAAPAASKSAAPSQGGGSGNPRPAGQFGPAASGEIAALTGSTMQVQSQQNGQVAVSWAASTTFRHTVSVALSTLKAGDCVIATAPSGTASTAATFTAATLVVSAPVKGTCGGGGGNGQRPSSFPSGQRPTNFPTGKRPSGNRPSGAPSGAPGRGGFGAIANGKVSSVSGSKVVISAQQRGSSTSKDKTITVGSTTKLTTEAATTSHSLQVGKCVTAQGKADSTGTVTATSVQITDASNGKCTSGFGGFGRRGNGG